MSLSQKVERGRIAWKMSVSLNFPSLFLTRFTNVFYGCLFPVSKIKISSFAWVMLLSGTHALSNQPAVASVSNARWVSGSNVNLRSAASLEAAIIKRLAINTQVKLMLATVEGQKFCEVETLSGEKGFVACQYISVKAISNALPSSESVAGGRLNPDSNPERSFWLNPSAETLIRYAQELTATRLTPAQMAAEEARKPKEFKYNEKTQQLIPEPILQRAKVPKLEAMKEQLANGVVPSPPVGQTLIAYKGIQEIETLQASLSEKVNQGIPYNTMETARAAELSKLRAHVFKKAYFNLHYSEELVALSKHIFLPKVATSFFKLASEVAPPSAGTEQVSAVFSIPHTVQTSSGPRWLPEGHHGSIHIGGAWDFGNVAVQLSQPIMRTTIFRSGKLEVNEDRLLRSWYITKDGDGDCPEGFSFGKPSVNMSVADIKYDDKGQVIEGKRRVPYTGNALLNFYSGYPAAADRAQIKSTRTNQKIAIKDFNFGALSISSTELILIDLDGDGIEDFAVWEATGRSPNEIHAPARDDPYLRYFFVNVKGEWFYFDRDEYVYGCGC